MPSSLKAKKAILALLPEESGKIFELGSGWGHLALPLARRLPKSQIFGYEVSPIPYGVSLGVKKIFSPSNLTLKKKDFFEVPFEDVDGIVCYLYPGGMKKLKEKFEKELKPGAFVITNTFSVPGWEPDACVSLNDIYQTKVYFYQR